MIQYSRHRRVERLTVPRRFRGRGLGLGTMQILDLSPAGARIEHVMPLRAWSGYPVDLPDALGGGQVRGQVVWSRVAGRTPVGEGKLQLAYQSGLAFNEISPEEQIALAGVLVRIAGECAFGVLRELRPLGEREPAHQARFDALCSELQGWLRQEIEALRFEHTP